MARLRPVGDAAVTLELGDALDPALAARARALQQRLDAEPFEGYRESVPSYRALLVLYDPARASYDAVGERLLALARSPAAPPAPGERHEVAARYGGEAGPDLAEAAERLGLSEDELVARHSGRDYEALMLGFMPGFAYLGLLPAELELPRRATPRTRVPAGSVGIAGRQTGIYPAASPGGWHLLARTSLRLFDPRADPPVRLRAGDRVRFVPVAELPGEAPADAGPAPAGAAALEVLEGGLLTSVQAGPRDGLRRLGISGAGALDPAAQAAANALVGNPAGAATLECTLVGPSLRFLAGTRFALAGADLQAQLERDDLGRWPVPVGLAVRARAGNVLTFGERRSGCRAYVAFEGGLDLPALLGSASTDLKAGFGGHFGRALRAGDRLALARAGGRAAAAPAEARAALVGEQEEALRVVLGPQDDHFSAETLAQFLGAAFTLSSESDRFGARLDGPRLAPRGPGEIVSDALLPGCIQVPPDGRPIVALHEGPTTGGYPKIATIVSADLRRLAQLPPGSGRLRFRAVTLAELRSG